jgi:hypothetical protein
VQLPLHFKTLLNLFPLHLLVERVIPLLNLVGFNIDHEKYAWGSSCSYLWSGHRPYGIHHSPFHLHPEDILMEVFIECGVSERPNGKPLNLSLSLA